MKIVFSSFVKRASWWSYFRIFLNFIFFEAYFCATNFRFIYPYFFPQEFFLAFCCLKFYLFEGILDFLKFLTFKTFNSAVRITISRISISKSLYTNAIIFLTFIYFHWALGLIHHCDSYQIYLLLSSLFSLCIP